MRILWASHSAGLLGAERCLAEAVKGLRSRGVSVHVVVPFHGPLVPALTAMGVAVSVVRFDWWTSPSGWRSLYYRTKHAAVNITGWRNVLRHLRMVGPDLVVTNTLTIPMWAVASKQLGIPHVWYIHEFGREDHDLVFDFGNRWALRQIDRLSDRIIVSSESVRAKFDTSLSSEKIRLARYAVEIPQEFSEVQRDGELFNLALVGAVTRNKGQEEAIDAISVLAHNGLNVRLFIVGNSSHEFGRQLRRRTDDLQLNNSIQFVNFTDNPFQYFANSDIALMCSRSEAFGRVTIEAMKMGKPVIGAAQAGTMDLIQDGLNGLLYESGNANDLAEKISKLYYDRSAMLEMGHRAQLWATGRFSTERYTDDLLEIFRETIEGSPIAFSSAI